MGRNLTSSPLSSSLRVREGDTGPEIETPGRDRLPAEDSLRAGSASFEWGGASNVAPKRIVKPPRTDWLCSQCKIDGNLSEVIRGYRIQCPYGHRRR